MNKYTLSAQKRQIVGRKVKSLRKEGILPVSLYGKDIASMSLQTDLKKFKEIERKVGESGLVYLKVDSQEFPTLIANLQSDPVSGQPLHADFHKVNLKESVTARVPIEIVGIPPAVTENQGILIQPLSEVEVVALPTDLPEKITVDVATLSQVDQAIFVKDLQINPKVKIIDAADEIVVKIAPLAKEEKVEAPPPEEIPTDQAIPAEAASPADTSPAPQPD